MRLSRWLGLFGVLAFLAVIGMLIAQRMEREVAKRAEQKKPVVVVAPAVRVTKVAPHEFVTYMEATGEVRPLRTVQVFPKLGGRVEKLTAGLSDEVKAGQALAQVEENDLGFRDRQGVAGTRAASAQVRAAQVQAENARIELERAEGLFAAKALPEADVIRVRGMKKAADAALAAAKAQVDVAKAGSDLAKEALSWTEVTAPIDGVITRRYTELGASAGTQLPMFEIQDQSALQIFVDVPAVAAVGLAKDDKATFRVDEKPGKVFLAKVLAVARALDPMTRRVRVELEVDGAVVGEGVLPLMLATVSFETGRETAERAVPREAVVKLAEGPTVFAVRDGKAVRLAPDLTKSDATHVAVPTARPDDRIVIEGQARLRDGDPVTEVDAAAAPKPTGATP